MGQGTVSTCTVPPECRVAVLVPCYNEEQTIAKVVRDFRAQLPSAKVYVFDNNSTDQTIHAAQQAGAIVHQEARRGKGYVLRTMFSQVEADLYVMVDGDGTYPADKVYDLIRPILCGEADMVIGSRLLPGSHSRFKVLNLTGNKLFLLLLNSIFRVHITDLLSGYRAIRRQLVKGLPLLSRGFESETELTVKCLERGYRILEVPVALSPRPEGSRSKIRLFHDGLLILNTIFSLARDYKPLTSFGLLGLILVICGSIPGVMVIREFVTTGEVQRLPSALLAAGLMLSGLLVAFTGLALHSIARHFQELDCQIQRLFEAQDRAGHDATSDRSPR